MTRLASPNATTPAIAAMRSPSVRSCATTRPRLAPSDRRIAISVRRAVARASMTFETLAQAASSTTAKAAKTGDSTPMSSRVSGAGVACGSSSATDAGRSVNTGITAASAAAACSGVLSWRRRAITASSRGSVAPNRSCLITAPCIVAGTHRSGGVSLRPTNSSAITPTTVSV